MHHPVEFGSAVNTNESDTTINGLQLTACSSVAERNRVAEGRIFRRQQSSMPTERAALGGMLEQLVDLNVREFSSEPLDAIVERRLTAI